MIQTDAEPIRKQIAALERMTVGQLRERYGEVFGEPVRSGNRQWLFRRVAWRIQLLAEGDLAIRALERAHSRAKELARDADLRVRPPHGPANLPAAAERVASGTLAIRRDERVPPPGTVLTRVHKGREHRVAILTNGFEYEGDVYRSLSAVAHAITGSHWNGLHFFGLAEPKRRKEASR